MSAPLRRTISYLPGRWTALVTDDLALLADVQLADPTLGACWDAAAAGGADAVLDVLARPGAQPVSFVLVVRSLDAVRLVVAGRAHAEAFAGSADPVVHGSGVGGVWVEQRLDSGFDVRLVADDPTPFERLSPLPLTSGIVLASYVFATAVPGAGGPQDEPAGWTWFGYFLIRS